MWSFLETGRSQKSFETIEMIGEGGCGKVNKVRHKIDNRISALKEVPMHVKFDPQTNCPILSHPAMKEIEAISKLNHKNIVGYKGCWIETDDLDQEQLDAIIRRLKRKSGWAKKGTSQGIITESD